MIRFMTVFMILAALWAFGAFHARAESYSAFEPETKNLEALPTEDSGVEDAETIPAITSSAPLKEAPSVQKKSAASKPTAQLPRNEKQTLENEPKKLKKSDAKRDQFETVSKQHTDSVAARLKLVGEILRQYGRAYDYRSLTLSELTSILNQLDQENFWSQ